MLKGLQELSRADIAIMVFNLPLPWFILAIPKSYEKSKELWKNKEQIEPFLKYLVFVDSGRLFNSFLYKWSS